MNTLQVCRQLQYLLTKRCWGSTSEPVFASVVVTYGPAEEAANAIRTPLAIIRPVEADVDPQAPGAMRQSYEITIITANVGDTLGQTALIGGNRTGGGTQGQDSSLGRGLLELEEELLAVVTYLDQTSGLRLNVVRKGAVQGAFDPNEGYVCSRSYTVDSRTSVARSYDAPLSFKGTASGGGNAALTWKALALRFDFDTLTHDNNQQVSLGSCLVLKRIAGSTPPKFPHESGGPTGTIVQTWTTFPLPTSYTDAAGAGTWSYALAGGFDETGSGTVERWSDVPATITGLVVT